MTPGGRCAVERLLEGVHPRAQGEVERHRRRTRRAGMSSPTAHGEVGPVGAVAGGRASTPAAGSRRPATRRREAAARSGASGGAPPDGSLGAAPRSSGTKRTVSPGRSWPSFQRSARHHGRRAGEPAEAGPVGAEQHGVSPVKSTRAERVRRCRAGSTGAARPRRRPAGPSAASGRRGGRRCGRECSCTSPVAPRRTRRCRRR